MNINKYVHSRLAVLACPMRFITGGLQFCLLAPVGGSCSSCNFTLMGCICLLAPVGRIAPVAILCCWAATVSWHQSEAAASGVIS